MKPAHKANPWKVHRASGPPLALLFLLSVVVANFFVVHARERLEFSFPPLLPHQPAAPMFQRAFDGGSATQAMLPRFAVVIDNMHEGHPPAGVDDAGLVIESPVEAGITRWLAFFEFDTPPGDPGASPRPIKVGPVRSLRPYFLDWGRGYHTPIAHVGGSPEALALAAKSPLLTVNEFAFGRYFFRDPQRRDPHRVFTSAASLQTLLKQLNPTEAALTMPWSWEKPHDAPVVQSDSAAPAAKKSTISYRFTRYPLPPEPELSWRYHPEKKVFERSQGGELSRDEAGAVVSAKHVFVVETSVVPIDSIGRRRITTTGRGTAWRLTPEGKQRLTWERADDQPYRFTTADGASLILEPGNVWIIVVPVGQEVVESF